MASVWIGRGVCLAIGVLLGILVHSRAQVGCRRRRCRHRSSRQRGHQLHSQLIPGRTPPIRQPSDDDLEYDSDEGGEGQPTQRRRLGPRTLGSQPREELKMVLVSCSYAAPGRSACLGAA